MESNRKIYSLQALRAIAFIGIFLAHAKIVYSWPKLGVSIFFCLSGFLMTYVYMDRDLPVGLKESFLFSVKKIKKLYMLHIITMVAAVLIELWIGKVNGNILSGGYVLLRNIILNVLLLQSWYPDSTVNVALNGVAWYLSVALFLYMLFPFILRWIKKSKVAIVVTTAVIIVVMQVLLSYIALLLFHEGVQYTWFMYCFPVFRIGDFFAGCALFKVLGETKYVNNKSETIVYTIVEIIAFVAIIIFSVWLEKPGNGYFITAVKNWSSCYIIMALVLIYLFYRCNGLLTRFLSNKFFIALGDISPQAFLIHYVIVRFANAYMGLHQIPFTIYKTWLLFIAEFIITVVISLLYLKIKNNHRSIR
ncbi:MAG: acyltransferase [Pseudobutyrivibrio sp.]|uniref:acyltransferase family protein n=1 Tax=Pseudobutyrivibrio sp. TaxID=2014367 RepID=UPI0025D692A4|nr:acyltransferase [Pseudobutyrivibrio sp.]MBQ6461710.1 acyltransferase [Pseudobutyrivibrio sp.]